MYNGYVCKNEYAPVLARYGKRVWHGLGAIVRDFSVLLFINDTVYT
jgi:hypothetical protein